VHQALLSSMLQEFVATAPRMSFISQNKEGIISLVGFSSLYLISIQIGNFLHKLRQQKEWLVVSGLFGVASVVLWICAIGLEYYFGLVPSGKTANFPFILYSLVFTLQPLSLMIGIDSLIFPLPSVFLDMLTNQRNSQLILFLIANVLTGVINLSIKTLYTPDPIAFIIISIYMFGACFLSYMVIKILKWLEHK